MATNISFLSFDPSVLVSLFQAQLAQSSAQSLSRSAQQAALAPPSATAKDAPPWQTLVTPAQQLEDAKVLSTTNFLDLSKVPLTASATDAKTEQDNQRLFALYNAVNSLTYLSRMSQRDTMTDGQRQGLNTRFQAALKQVQSFISTTKFNNFALQTGSPASSVTSTATVPFANFGYTGTTLVNDANVALSLPGLSTTDSFKISITVGGTTTDVAINLSQVQGQLSIDNVVNYVNQQLSAAGFSTRFSRTFTAGSINDPSKASYGIAINPGGSESVSLSSAAATPALYLVGNAGSPIATTSKSGTVTTTTPPDQQGRIVKLTGLANPQSQFSNTMNPTTGNTTAQASAVDASGNLYVIGNATGNLGSQLNQGTQDVYLSKYNSAGNLRWRELLGSTGTAAGYSLALNPAGGVVIAGSTTADLTQSAIANGNTDSFVAKYDANGTQTWVTQLPTLSSNQAASVTLDSTGNVYIGGQVTGSIGVGQASAGGSDGYVTKLNSTGKVVYAHQFGTSGADSVGATATLADGSLVVASVENGHAFLSKYANGDATAAPTWRTDLGSLNGGSIGGMAISGSNIYVSGTTSNANLTAGGQATIATASSGGADAFVFNLVDQGASVSANHISYVGTAGTDTAGAVTVGPDGTVYLSGTTTGTFAGQTRSVANSNNMFVAALNGGGAINWARQYGGADGQSTGQSIAVDAQGASVLDALGLPHGTINNNAAVDLATQTTLRAGNSFSIQIQGTTTRTTTITIDPGETLSSLVTKINGELVNVGKASVGFSGGAEGLKIQLNPGFTASLIAGPKDFDALGRLGITAETLTNTAVAKHGSQSSATGKSTTNKTQLFGLGLNGALDITTRISAGGARAQLMNALSAIQRAYQTTNAPPPSTTPQITGTAPAYLQSQLANFSLAAELLNSSASSSSGSVDPTGITSLFA